VKPSSYRVAAIARPVEILYDPWGIPHIFAETEPDAFFAQGFAAARDRLWQIDLARRRALGRLAAVFGPSLVPYDRAARLFLYRGDEKSEWLNYGPRIETDAAAFCAGLNAWVQLVLEGSVTASLEFTRLGYLPEFCQPSDFIRTRMADLQFRANSKVRRARLAQLNALQFDEIVCHLEPPWKVVVPDGFDPFSVSVEDLRLYQLLSAPLPQVFQSDSDTLCSNSSSEGAFQRALEHHGEVTRG
jgi:penicillin G amidase